MGGQAVLEGVMMRGASTWAIAVRKPDGEIDVDVRTVPGWSDKYNNIPVCAASRASPSRSGWATARSRGRRTSSSPKRNRSPRRRSAGPSVPVALFFSVIFIVIPALAGHGLSHRDPRIVPGRRRRRAARAVRRVPRARRLLKDIKRVFQYHGAEHKAIAAYENDVELTPEDRAAVLHRARALRHQLPAHRDGRRGARVLGGPAARTCGSSIGSRIVLMPVIAGLAYEVIRLAAKNMQRRWVRVLVRPGLWLQKLTTREPDLDQLEVAIASLQAVFTEVQTAEVDARVGRLVPAIAPAV